MRETVLLSGQYWTGLQKFASYLLTYLHSFWRVILAAYKWDDVWCVAIRMDTLVFECEESITDLDQEGLLVGFCYMKEFTGHTSLTWDDSTSDLNWKRTVCVTVIFCYMALISLLWLLLSSSMRSIMTAALRVRERWLVLESCIRVTWIIKRESSWHISIPPCLPQVCWSFMKALDLKTKQCFPLLQPSASWSATSQTWNKKGVGQEKAWRAKEERLRRAGDA